MIAASIKNLEFVKISSSSLRYFLNSYGCHIQNDDTFDDILITNSSHIQSFINKNIKYEFKRYTEINKIIKYLENQGHIQFITNATQKEINDISGSFVNSTYNKKKGKKFLAQKKKKQSHLLTANKF